MEDWAVEAYPRTAPSPLLFPASEGEREKDCLMFDYYKHAGPLGLGSGFAKIKELFVRAGFAAVAADRRSAVRGQCADVPGRLAKVF